MFNCAIIELEMSIIKILAGLLRTHCVRKNPGLGILRATPYRAWLVEVIGELLQSHYLVDFLVWVIREAADRKFAASEFPVRLGITKPGSAHWRKTCADQCAEILFSAQHRSQSVQDYILDIVGGLISAFPDDTEIKVIVGEVAQGNAHPRYILQLCAQALRTKYDEV